MNQTSGNVIPGAPAESLCYDHVLAVVCGVSDYSGWRGVDGVEWADDLKGVKPSVTRMTRWLEGSVGAEVLSAPDPANATAPQITQLIDRLGQRLANESTNGRRVAAVVYLAGHGRKQGRIGHFLAARAKNDEYNSRDQIWLGRIPSEFEQKLAQAHHLLFILDCCYAGLAVPRQAGVAEDRVLREYLRRRAVQIACACGADQLTSWDAEQGMLFTELFLDAVDNLNGEAIAVGNLIDRVKLRSALGFQSPYIVPLGPSQGQFIVGIPTRQQLARKIIHSLDKPARMALQQLRQLLNLGVTFTRPEASRKFGDKVIDHLMRNHQLEQRSDDYLYLGPPPTGSSRE